MFNKGDKVVCIDASGDNDLIEGNIYTIKFAGFVTLPPEHDWYFIFGPEDYYTIHIHEVQHKKEYVGWKVNRFEKLTLLRKIQEALIKDVVGLEKIKKYSATEIKKKIEEKKDTKKK